MEPATEKEDIETILWEIFSRRGFDIRDYKLSVLQHKIAGRMDVLGIHSLAEYAKYLESSPNEYKVLFDMILVDTSQFFRDPPAWDFLRGSVLPKILEKKEAQNHSAIELRFWSAGCGSGEEPYSLAITLAEALSGDIDKYKIRIYATDIDESALKIARSGTYMLDQLSEIPECVKEKYFVRRGKLFYTVSSGVRDLVTFGKQNLVSDPPISNIDLLLCRNVLMYFDQALQSRIVPKLRYALNDRGYLWLGGAETLTGNNVYGFRPLSIRWRIFEKIPSTGIHPELATYLSCVPHSSANGFAEHNLSDLIGAPACQEGRVGVIVLDKDYRVLVCNQNARNLLSSEDSCALMEGWPFFSLNISYQPFDLEHRIQQAITNGEVLTIDNLDYWVTKDRRIWLRMEIVPVQAPALTDMIAVVLLEDITDKRELQKHLQMAIESLEVADRRLSSIDEERRELEVINESLQSKNKELESIIEDLKAENERLKLMNK